MKFVAMAKQLEVQSTFEIPSWLPDRVKDEINILTSIHSGEEEVTILKTTEADEARHVTIQVSPDQYPCKVIFTLSEDYPSKSPDRIEVSEKDSQKKQLPDDILQNILQVLYQTAQESIGSPVICSMVERFKSLLQEHERQTKEDGLKLDRWQGDVMPFPGGFAPEFESDKDETKPKKKEKSKEKRSLPNDTDIVKTKKPPMKTATDVIHRIMWDECLNQKDFIVGYLDRFVGIIEKPFAIFDWGDIAEADFLALAVPRHRIQYFKYKDVTVWDKTQRLDLVFGSTGSGTTIRDIIKKFEKEDGNFEEKEVCEPKPKDEEMIVDGAYAADRGEDSANLDEMDNDDDEKLKKAKKSNRVTHFIAIRITAPEVIENIQKFQENVCQNHEVLKKACIVPEKLHITLLVMQLETTEEMELATKVLKDLEYDLALCFSPLTLLHFKRIECWQSRVVVSPVEGHEKETLQKGSKMISSKLEEAGIKVKNEKREFAPHLTAMKVKFSSRRKNKKFKISEDIIKPHQDIEHVCQDVDEIHLCSIAGKPREDGFYQTIATVSAYLE